jgi:acetyltransferase-like isoleucine patch superfamily enzyme
MNKLIYIMANRLIQNPNSRAKFFKNIVKMGEDCQIFSKVEFGSEPYLIELGNKVKITSGVKFITHDGGMYVLRNMGISPNADKFGRIVIGNNVFIGWDTIVMPNVRIGDNCVIGAGSVVTKDIPSDSVVAGVPARVLCSINKYYEKNKHLIDNTKHMSDKEKKKYIHKKYINCNSYFPENKAIANRTNN